MVAFSNLYGGVGHSSGGRAPSRKGSDPLSWRFNPAWWKHLQFGRTSEARVADALAALVPVYDNTVVGSSIKNYTSIMCNSLC